MKGPPPTLRVAQTVVWAFWAALAPAPIIYAIVLRNVHLTPPSNTPPLVQHQPVVFIGLGIFLGFMSLVVRQMFLGRLKSGQISSDSTAGIKTCITGHILCFAFAEAVGILGLMLGFLGHRDLAENFLMSSLGLMLFHMPLASRFQPGS